LRGSCLDLWIGWSLFVVVSVGAVFRTLPNHDVSWLLYVARRFLAGDRLYVDLVEVNPPLIILLSTPAAWISQHTGLQAVDVFRAGTLLLQALVAVVIFRSLRDAAPDSGGRSRFLFAIVCFSLLVLLPGYDFSQREHLLVAAILPYLVVGAARLQGLGVPLWILVLSALLASTGLLLKPHFVPAWIGLEALITARTRRAPWTRPEAVIVAVTGLAYAIALILFVPSYIDLARLSAPVYGTFNNVSWGLLMSKPWVPAALLAVLVWYRFSLPGFWRELGRATLPALVAFVAAVFVQAKGWTYHWLPVQAGILLLFFATIFSRAREGPANQRLLRLSHTRLARTAVLCALLLAVARFVGAPGLARLHSPYVAVLSPVVEQLPPNASVYTLSATVRVSFPLVTLYDLRWTSRFNSLWLLPGVVALPHDPEVAQVRQYLFDAVVEDLSQERPDFLIVDSALSRQPGFDYIGFFSSDSRFEKLIADYDSVGASGRFVLYERGNADTVVRRVLSGS
jgi:hypothetical protein